MKFVDLIFLGRPMLVIPVWTVYLHFLAFSSDGEYLLVFPGREAIYQLVVLALIFMGGYIINQIFDIESDRLNDKLYFLPRGIISPALAWVCYFALTIGGLGLAVFLCPEAIRAVLAIIGLGILYSVPGIRLKDSPVGGLVTNAFAYGFLIPWMSGLGSSYQLSIVAMTPYFLAVAAGYILTTIPDLDGDMATGKRTVAVILGPKGALWLTLLTTMIAAATAVWVGNIEMAIVAALTFVGVIYLLFSFKFRVLMLTCKIPILLLTLLAGVHYLFYAVLLLLTINLTRFYYKRRFGVIYPKLG